jgi:hypothetical protein
MRPGQDLPIHCPAFFEDDDEATKPAIVTPPPNSKFEDNFTSRDAAATAAATEQWVQASCVLRDNPARMTSRVLILALRNQPPVHVVRFMLSVNPKAASIPKKGPTPLQVAVQSNASIEVVQLLLESCPFALCVTNPDHAEDPLSYAKRHRKGDKTLIELLGRPLSFWITERSRDARASLTSFRDEERQDARNPPPPPPPPPPPSVDRQELYNVKLLCAQVLKGHKKLAKQVVACKEKLEEARFDKTQVLKDLHEQQKKHFYTQLIALDMKEKAMRAHVNRMEERFDKKSEARVQGWKKGLDSWKSTTEERMREWNVLLEHDITINAHFRKDVSEWMEETSTTVTPIVFATSLGELNEEAPLFPKDELDHVKKRPWKPLFRHWDRIKLQDDEEG